MMVDPDIRQFPGMSTEEFLVCSEVAASERENLNQHKDQMGQTSINKLFYKDVKACE